MNPEHVNAADAAAGARDFRPAARLRGIEKSMIRQLFDRALPGSINLGLGEPDLPTPDVIRRAAVRVIEDEQNGYTTHAGLPALRALVAADYPQLDAAPDNVIITAGSQEALYLALMTLVDAGDEVLLPDPGFVAYPTIVRMAGGRPVFYRLPARDGFAFDVEDFRRRLTPRTKAVVLVSPSNPTGRTFSRADLAAMAGALRDSSAYVISDEIYREIYFGDERPGSISEECAARSIVIGGLSKSMSMTGWRTGWMYGAAEVIRSALVLHGYVTTCASTVSQKAALAAWTGEAEAARADARRIFRARRDHLLSLIASELKLPAIAPEGAFYLMLDVSAHGSSMEVAERLLAHRVITVPGSAFGAEGEGYLRLSFCADAPTLAEGVERIKVALERKREAGN
ncbi:MAG TPA: aminotransferase class I/II-fold pyridoxal phosphate-dependent enzyme [Pyrinomonadaceae bacterium]|nr:aminotransferase class I/II-fold pyridoxal phosphate-dependent enzyme [Pyrinomonadaceae bacterium]